MLIQRLSGSPSASAVYTSTVYTSTTGFLKVFFTSDGSVVGSGFTGTWSCGALAATTECTNCTAGTYSATEGAPDCTNCASSLQTSDVCTSAGYPDSCLKKKPKR
jgi:hypothetical protein